MKEKNLRGYGLLVVTLLLGCGIIACSLSGSKSARPTGTAKKTGALPQRAVTSTRTPRSTISIFPTPAFSPTIVPTIVAPTLWPWENLPSDNPYGTIMQTVLALDPSDNGVVHIVWNWEDQENTYHYQYSRRSVVDGKDEWSPAVEIYRYTAAFPGYYSSEMAIAIDPQGLPHVSWISEQKVFYTSLSADGNWPAPTTIELPSLENQPAMPTSLVFDARAVLNVFWINSGSLYWSQWKPEGGLSPAKQIPNKMGDVGYLAAGSLLAVAVSSQGVPCVAWVASYNIYFSELMADGEWSQPAWVGKNPTYTAPVMVVDFKGSVHLVYDGDTFLWYAKRDAGGKFQKSVRIPNTQGLQLHGRKFQLVLAGSGSLFLIWPSEPYEGFPYQFLTKKPDEFWAETVSSVSNTASAGSYSVIGGSDGVVHLAWGTAIDFRYAEESFDHVAQAVGSAQEIIPPPNGVSEFLASTGTYTITEWDTLDIGDQFIVWSANDGESKNVYRYELEEKKEIPVIIEAGDQTKPATNGKWILWEDQRDTTPRIYAWEIGKGNGYPLTADSSPQWEPDISGNIVVFRDWRKIGSCSWGSGSEFGPSTYCDWDIWGMNLETKGEFPVAESSEPQYSPQVSSEWVIWKQDLDSGDWAVFARRIAPDAPVIQLPIGSKTSTRSDTLDGNLIVFDQWEEQANQTGIFGYDLESSSEFPIAYGWDKQDPAIQGNLVVWSDTRNGDSDIYAYNLFTGQEFAVCIENGDQWNPVVYGDTVAWFDGRNTRTQVYAATLPSMNGAQTGSFVPALEPTPTPMPTIPGTPVPTTTPHIPPNKPRLIMPENNVTVESLVPLISFDLGRNMMLGHGFWDIFDPPFETFYIESNDSIWTVRPAINLAPGVTYRWKVRPASEECEENVPSCPYDSDTWSFTVTTQPIQIPNAPKIISPPNNATVNFNDLVFQWEPVAGAIAYRFQGSWVDASDSTNIIDYRLIEPSYKPYSYEKWQGKVVWSVQALTDLAWSEITTGTIWINP
jgi:TolB protein